MLVQMLEATVVLLAAVSQVTGYLRVCYYTNWSQYRPGNGKYTPDKIEPGLCTHIIFAFAKLEDNRLVPFEWNDDNTEWSKGMYAKVNATKKINPNLKTLLATGGWNAGSLVYSDMVSTKANRDIFVSSTIDFLRQRGFDGLDMDWEYPAKRGGRPEDKQNLVRLLEELRVAFDQEALLTGNDRLLLTAAVPAGKANIDAGYDVPKVARLLDFINLMSYDFHGSWESNTGHNSPLYARRSEKGMDVTLNMDWAAHYWVQMGAPRDKLIIGIGLYGRSFNLVSPTDNAIGSPTKGKGPSGKFTREAGFMAYYEVCEELKKGARRIWNQEHRVPYIVKGDIWVGYDDPQSIKEKINWLKTGGFGGVMVWSLALDDFSGKFCNSGKYPLMRVINRELGNIVPQSRFDGSTNLLPGVSSASSAVPTLASSGPLQPSVQPRPANRNALTKPKPIRINNVLPSSLKRPLDIMPLESFASVGPEISGINVDGSVPPNIQIPDSINFISQHTAGTQPARSSNSQRKVTNRQQDQTNTPKVMPIIPMEITNKLLSSPENSEMFPLNGRSGIAPASFTNLFSSQTNEIPVTMSDISSGPLPPPVIIPMDNSLNRDNSISAKDSNQLASELSVNALGFSSAINNDALKTEPNRNMQPKTLGMPKTLSTKLEGFALPELKRGPDGSFIVPPARLEETNSFGSETKSSLDPEGPRIVSLFDRNLPSPVGEVDSPKSAAIHMKRDALSFIQNKADPQSKPTPTQLSLSPSDILSALDQRLTATVAGSAVSDSRPLKIQQQRSAVSETQADLSSSEKGTVDSNRTRTITNTTVISTRTRPVSRPFIRPVIPANIRRAIVTMPVGLRTVPGQRGVMRQRNAIVINPRQMQSRLASQNNRRLRRPSLNNVRVTNRLNAGPLPTNISPTTRTVSRMNRPVSARPTELVASIIGGQPLTASQAVALRMRLNSDIRIVPL